MVGETGTLHGVSDSRGEDSIDGAWGVFFCPCLTAENMRSPFHRSEL